MIVADHKTATTSVAGVSCGASPSALKQDTVGQETPDYVQCSTAAAMTLGLIQGRFWRGAQLRCINLLQTYDDGCKGACAYCGLNRLREQESSFIRVPWPTYSLQTIIDRLKVNDIAQRVCISMLTHRRAVEDTLEISRRIRAEVDILISGLVTPTLIKADDLPRLKDAGIDKLGIAIDNANPDVFDRMRGRKRGGPHRQEIYWERFAEAVPVFGHGNVGTHLMLGLGDTEQDMALAMQRARDLGGVNHLFSFFPEKGTAADHIRPPHVDAYRRVQLAAEIIDADIARADDFEFEAETGKILSFGISPEQMDELIDAGRAFMTRGCYGSDGEVACNRPFGNSPPGDGVRNYPFEPDEEDIARVRTQLAGDWVDEGVMSPDPPLTRAERKALRDKAQGDAQ